MIGVKELRVRKASRLTCEKLRKNFWRIEEINHLPFQY
jgi:hypothetical protein